MRKTLRSATVGVMVTLGLAGVGPTASADQSEPLAIVLQVRDTAHVLDEVLTGAQAHVTAHFRQAGVQTVWRDLLLDNAHSRIGLRRADWRRADLQRVQRSELLFAAEQGERLRSRTGRVSAPTPVVVGFLEGDTHAYVRSAVEGAAARLAHPGCQALLTDFSNASGVPLSTALAATGKTPVEVFARLGSSRTVTRGNASGARCWRSHRSARRSFASVDGNSDFFFAGNAVPLSSS